MPDDQDRDDTGAGASRPIRLTASDLSAVRGGRRVLAGLSFTVATGELLAVTGPNGAGKSTLLRLIAGLLRPVGGQISFAPASEERIGGRLHYLGHLDGLKVTLSVRQNLQFWADLWSSPGTVDKALEALGLTRLATFPVAVLSAGQRRRTALARLLLIRRPLWLLDEPATGVDKAAEAMLGEMLRAHLGAGGLAVVATHLDPPVKPAATLALGAE
ncbi:MAG: heme ABC exporter ATP-binding protein CcmA [Bauldia sp.]